MLYNRVKQKQRSAYDTVRTTPLCARFIKETSEKFETGL